MTLILFSKRLLLFCLLLLSSFVLSFNPGDQVLLQLHHENGIPLHEQARAVSPFDFIDDSQTVTIIDVEDDVWFRVLLADGRLGWISKRYLGALVRRAPLAPHFDTGEQQVWSSTDGCLEALELGKRMPKEDAEALRIGTWNIRWFPFGCPENSDCADKKTDILWLACSIAWMKVDVLAVQEILSSPKARQSMNSLLDLLGAFTSSVWKVDLQDCGGGSQQKVGFLWNTDKATLLSTQDLWQLNGRANRATQPCLDRIRPGRYALVKTPEGLDVQLISVHFDSGRDSKSYSTRQTSFERLDELMIEHAPLVAIEEDLIILGDFNTMGQASSSAGPSDEITARDETLHLDLFLAPELERIEPDPFCTEYFEEKAGALDHITVSRDMQEADVVASVAGYCALLECKKVEDGTMPLAFERLSDHCPVVFDLTNQDIDAR